MLSHPRDSMGCPDSGQVTLLLVKDASSKPTQWSNPKPPCIRLKLAIESVGLKRWKGEIQIVVNAGDCGNLPGSVGPPSDSVGEYENICRRNDTCRGRVHGDLYHTST